MRANRSKGTIPEVTLERGLAASGITRFQRSPSSLPGRPDFVFPERKIVVFVHGCFWHRCPRHAPTLPKSNPDYWRLKFELNRKRDARKIADLGALGWGSFVVWECEIRDDLARCVERIREALT